MISLPSHTTNPTNKKTLLELIKEVLDLYAIDLKSDAGENRVEDSNNTNWLFFNCNYKDSESEFGDAIFGIAEYSEFRSCQPTFQRLASIDASSEQHTPRIFVDNGYEVEDCGEVNEDVDGWQNDAALMIFNRIQDILEGMNNEDK